MIVETPQAKFYQSSFGGNYEFPNMNGASNLLFNMQLVIALLGYFTVTKFF